MEKVKAEKKLLPGVDDDNLEALLMAEQSEQFSKAFLIAIKASCEQIAIATPTRFFFGFDFASPFHVISHDVNLCRLFVCH